MTFQLTDEQKAIVDAGVSTRDHILVTARAGAAKTFTLTKLAESLPKAKGVALVFNKNMKIELEDSMPKNFQCLTLNSLGHRAWNAYTGKRCGINTSKTYGITRDLVDAMPEGPEREAAFKLLSEYMRAVDFAKALGYVPEDCKKSRALCKDFFDDYHIEFEPWEQELIDNILRVSWEQGFDGKVDFNDQLWLTACTPCGVPFYDEIFVDESQDLNPCQHELVRRMATKRGARLVAVGDPFQAIYAFRGADTRSMEIFRDNFQMRDFALTTTFRCAAEIVEGARWRAPDLQAWEGTPPGTIEWPDFFPLDEIPEGAAILCRNNAPLFRCAVQFLKAKRNVEIVGSDVAQSIVTRMKKLGKPQTEREPALETLASQMAKEIKKSRAPKYLLDIEECIKLFLNETETLLEAINLAQRILAQKSKTVLSTGHKAKGRQWDTVIILESDLCNMEHEQDQNLLYVMQTRPKNRLVYASIEMLLGDSKDHT